MYSRIPYLNIDWNFWAIHCSYLSPPLSLISSVVRVITKWFPYRILRSLEALARSCSCSTFPYLQTLGSGSLVLPRSMVQPLEHVTRLLFAHLSRVFSWLNTSCLLFPQILHCSCPIFLGMPDHMLLHCTLVTLGSLSTPGLCHLYTHFTCFSAYNRVSGCRCWDGYLWIPHRLWLTLCKRTPHTWPQSVPRCLPT